MPVANSSFLSATPSPLVSVYFQTSSAFDSFGEDRVGAERHHEAREHHACRRRPCASRRLAVAVLVLVHRDAADRIELAGRVGVLHVAAQLEHEHAAVAVEGDLRRLLDVRIGQHRLELEAGRQPEPLLPLRRASAATTGGFFEKSGSVIDGPRPRPAGAPGAPGAWGAPGACGAPGPGGAVCGAGGGPCGGAWVERRAVPLITRRNAVLAIGRCRRMLSFRTREPGRHDQAGPGRHKWSVGACLRTGTFRRTAHSTLGSRIGPGANIEANR